MLDAEREILESLVKAVYKGNKELAIQSTDEALKAGLTPLGVMNEGIVRGMSVVSQKRDKKIYHLPQVLLSADAALAALNVVSSRVKFEKGKETAVICTVEGDLHDIGKNIVKMMLTVSGFNVIDLGSDVSPDKIVHVVRKSKASLVALSTLMTSTAEGMKKVVEGLREEGLRKEVKIMVGGGPISQAFAEDIGADLYAPNAEEAAAKAKALYKG